MSRVITFCFILIITFAGLAFHLRNDQVVTLDFYLGVLELPFSLYVILALCVGAILGIVVCLPKVIALKREKAKLEKHFKMNEKELNNLRVIPVRDPH